MGELSQSFEAAKGTGFVATSVRAKRASVVAALVAFLASLQSIGASYAAQGAAGPEAELAGVVASRCADVTNVSCVSVAIAAYLGTPYVAVATRRLLLLGEELVEVKAVMPNTPAAFHLVLASDGTLLPDYGAALLEQERLMWIQRWGKISPRLLDLLQQATKDLKIPVGIWLRMRSDPSASATKTPMDDPNAVQSYVALAAQATEKLMSEVSSVLPSNDIELQPYLGAPAVFGTLTADQIRAIARLDSVANIYYAPPPIPLAACDPSWTWVQTVGSDQEWSYYGYDGSGQTVCVIEPCYPDDYSYLRSAGTYYQGAGSCQDGHARFVSATVANTYPNGPNGIAVGARTYFANWAGTPRGNMSDPVYNGCRANGYRIWNLSHTSGDFGNRYFDYWVKHWPYPFISVASGNSGTCYPYSGGQFGVTVASFNTIIVNATQDANTAARSDDTLAASCGWQGCWQNPCQSPGFGTEWCPHGDRELPLISAPGHSLIMLGAAASGTSFASPTAGGAAALLHEENPNLRSWPEAVRAILMASATNDVDGTFFEPDNSSIDEKDGAGELNAFVAVLLGAAANYRTPGQTPATLGYAYGTLDFSSDCTTGVCSNYVYSIQGNSKGLPVRVVLTFDATAVCTDASSEASCAEDHLDADLDLLVRDSSTNAIVAASQSYDNSVEFVQFTPEDDQHVYNIEIWKWSNT